MEDHQVLVEMGFAVECCITARVYRVKDIRNGSLHAAKVWLGVAISQQTEAVLKQGNCAHLVRVVAFRSDKDRQGQKRVVVVQSLLQCLPPLAAPVAEEMLWKRALQCLLGLKCLHASGGFHGDVKAANVLRGPEGNCVLTDAGVLPLCELPACSVTLPAPRTKYPDRTLVPMHQRDHAAGEHHPSSAFQVGHTPVAEGTGAAVYQEVAQASCLLSTFAEESQVHWNPSSEKQVVYPPFTRRSHFVGLPFGLPASDCRQLACTVYHWATGSVPPGSPHPNTKHSSPQHPSRGSSSGPHLDPSSPRAISTATGKQPAVPSEIPYLGGRSHFESGMEKPRNHRPERKGNHRNDYLASPTRPFPDAARLRARSVSLSSRQPVPTGQPVHCDKMANLTKLPRAHSNVPDPVTLSSKRCTNTSTLLAHAEDLMHGKRFSKSDHATSELDNPSALYDVPDGAVFYFRRAHPTGRPARHIHSGVPGETQTSNGFSSVATRYPMPSHATGRHSYSAQLHDDTAAHVHKQSLTVATLSSKHDQATGRATRHSAHTDEVPKAAARCSWPRVAVYRPPVPPQNETGATERNRIGPASDQFPLADLRIRAPHLSEDLALLLQKLWSVPADASHPVDDLLDWGPVATRLEVINSYQQAPSRILQAHRELSLYQAELLHWLSAQIGSLRRYHSTLARSMGKKHTLPPLTPPPLPPWLSAETGEERSKPSHSPLHDSPQVVAGGSPSLPLPILTVLRRPDADAEADEDPATWMDGGRDEFNATNKDMRRIANRAPPLRHGQPRITLSRRRSSVQEVSPSLLQRTLEQHRGHAGNLFDAESPSPASGEGSMLNLTGLNVASPSSMSEDRLHIPSITAPRDRNHMVSPVSESLNVSSPSPMFGDRPVIPFFTGAPRDRLQASSSVVSGFGHATTGEVATGPSLGSTTTLQSASGDLSVVTMGMSSFRCAPHCAVFDGNAEGTESTDYSCIIAKSTSREPFILQPSSASSSVSESSSFSAVETSDSNPFNLISC
ncbi:hypothetical protein DIPPA_55751 [Diplonema papillatum]|nr:hypothetical protein DIPPA_55751 [Diplonema papillatum]